MGVRMPKKLHYALTPLAVKNAGPGRHADGGGLYLLVKPSGARSWIFRATVAGKVRDVGLGTAYGPNAITLARARELAADKAREVSAGTLLVSDLRKRALAAKAAMQAERIEGATFRVAAETHIALHEDGWRNDKHRAQWRATLEAYAYPHFGDLAVASIDTPHVLAALEPIWRAKPETARRVRGRIETILDAAKVRGLRSGENPARWRGHLDHLLPKRSKASQGHHAAMPYADVPSFMGELRTREAVAARALEFAIITAARSGEVLGATWGEVDLAAALWTIPGERMKAGREHRVPLPARAVEILRAVQPLNFRDETSAHLFPATRGGPLSGMAMAMLLRRMAQPITAHGFRSSFRDWAAEQTAFPFEVAEMALAHTVGNKVEAAYRRGDMFEKRRKLANAWADYCTAPAARAAKVSPIRQASA